MELGLQNKVALVPASSKGIGFGVAKVLAAEGCKVAICSRDQESISRASMSITKETGNKDVLAVRADISLKTDAEHLIDETKKKFGDHRHPCL